MAVLTQEEERRQAHYEKMTQTPVPRLVTTLAIPTIISMMVSALYNMADTFFVSQLGTSAVGAVGIVFSLMAIIQAIGFTLGMGSGTLVTLHLGAKQEEEATCAASTGFFSAIFLGILLTVFGSLFVEPMMRALGATATILPYAKAYGQYILLAAPVMCASFVMNNIFRYEGKATMGMLGIGTGGILNIILDPVFIFGLNLGTAGAAIATALSQTVSFLILLILFLKGKSDVRLRISKVSRSAGMYVNILWKGLPTLCRQGLASLASVALNVNAAVYGDAAVAAMSIVNRIMFFMFSAMLGFGQGLQPVAGFNFGAKKYRRVYDATRFAALVGVVVMAAFGAVIYLLSPQILRLFRKDDAEVIALGVFALRAQCVVMPLFGITTTTNMALQSTGKAGSATFLALCRQGIFFLPLIMLLPPLIGVAGVQLAQPLADVCTLVASLPFLVYFLRSLKKMDESGV
ncbi:MAG: MATE family efflux transporter [Eubacteriales bacterium]|nr:MATE family efflux transporter [Eubacteriales bacterium]